METQIFHIAPSAAKTWWLYLIMAGVVVLTIAAFGFVHYMVKSSLNATFEVGGGRLAIHGGFYGRSLSVYDLDLAGARVLDLQQDKSVTLGFKRNGTSMPGLKSGWFTVKRQGVKEKGLLFLTDPSKAVYIPTRQGYCLLLSPDDPQAFLETLRKAG